MTFNKMTLQFEKKYQRYELSAGTQLVHYKLSNIL